jgi:hypothetical protein
MPRPPYLARITKGVVHQKIEARVNHNPAERQRFLTALKNAPQDYVQLLVQHVELTQQEAQFLRTYWYNPNGWWPEAQPIEPKVSQSLIEALELAVEKNLPIDSYHVVGGGNEFDVVVVSSPWQITRLIVTPPVPPYTPVGTPGAQSSQR